MLRLFPQLEKASAPRTIDLAHWILLSQVLRQRSIGVQLLWYRCAFHRIRFCTDDRVEVQ